MKRVFTMMLDRRPTRQRGTDDAGFTMVEMVVALSIATMLFMALTYSSLAALRATKVARDNQQAIDIANAQIETMRQMPWGELGELVTTEGGPPSASTTAEVNNVTYSVDTYVTVPTNSTGDRAVKVAVGWTEYGEDRERLESTVVTKKSSGLPLPEFTLGLTTANPVTITPDSTAYWGLTITNQGAWDSWDLSATPGTGLEFRVDRTSGTNDAPDGFFDEAVDTLITSTDLTDPYDTYSFWAVATNTSTAGTYDWTVTAASEAQPSATSAQSSIDIQLVIEEVPVDPGLQACADPTATDPTVGSPSQGYSVVSDYLHNSGVTPWPNAGDVADGDPVAGTVASSPLDLTATDGAIPAGRDLPVYSTDLIPSATPGRLLYPGGSWTSTSQSLIVSFQTLTQSKWYKGTALLRLYVNEVDGGTAPIVLNAQLYKISVGATTTITALATSGLRTAASCADGYQELTFPFTISGVQKLGTNTYLGVRVINAGTEKVSLAYDHDDFPSRLVVVEK